MRRTAAWKPIAGVAAATIAIAGFGVAPASAAPGDTAEALAEVLGVELLGGEDLLGTARALSGYPSDIGDEADRAGLDLTLLQTEIELLEDGVTLPLLREAEDDLGLLAIGNAGVLTSYAHADDVASATASSGVLDENGAIAFDANEEAPDGSTTASLDATALLEQLGLDAVTEGIVNELALEIGAVASHAEEVDGVVTSDYRVADLTFDVSSPAVGQLVTGINSTLDPVESALTTSLNAALGPQGTLNSVVGNLPNLNLLGLLSADLTGATASAVVPDLSAVVNTALGGSATSDAIVLSTDGAVAINLTDGTVSLDLAQLVETIERDDPGAIGLNGFGPNTELLTPEVLSAITAGVTSALGSIVAPVSAAVQLALDSTQISIAVPVEVTAVAGTIDVATGTVSIQGSLAQIAAGQAGSVSAPITLIPGVIDVLALLGITLPSTAAITDALISGIVSPVLGTVSGVLDAALDTADASTVGAMTTLQGVLDALLVDLTPVFGALGQVVQLTVNVQPAAPPAPGMVTPFAGTEVGDLPGGFTVRALTVTVLPGLAGVNLANLDFASSSVSNVEPTAVAGTLELSPERVHEGDDVTIAGSGWNPDGGDVVVTFTDEESNPVGTPVTAALDGEGNITGTFPVPDPTTLGTLTGTATQDGAPTTDTVEVFGDPVIIVEPEPPVDPGTTVTIRGEGFVCGPLTVDILDGDTVIDSFTDVEVSEVDGSWSVVWPVPEELDVSQVTIRAYGSGECDEDEETPVDVDLPEDFDVTQAEARVGDVLDITGDGWTFGTDVTVTFTNGTTEVGVEPIAPAADGSIVGTFEVPLTAPTGELIATAVQGDDSLQDTVQIFGTATVAVDPTSVRAGGSVDVDGTGWLPNGGPVVVTATDEADETVGTVTIPQAEIGTGGTIAAVLTIDADADAGPVTVTAVQGDADAAASLTVLPEPTVTVFPGTVRPGDEVTIGGSNWGPGTVTVVFEYEDGSTDTVPIDPVDGAITDTYVVPGDAEAGPVAVTATQGDDEATTELEITLAPTVSAAPPTIHGGDTVTIGGSGWTGGDVTVTITRGGATVGTPQVLTPTGGVISGPYLVPDTTLPGALVVTATDGVDTATTGVTVIADPTIDVVPDPADPGQAVTITGTGWTCGPVDVTIASGSTQLAFFEEVEVVGTTWTQSWTVPPTITVDSVTITAVPTDPTACDDEGETELEVDLDETLAAAPSIVQRGQTVTLTGTGWSDGGVSIIARAPGGAVVGSFTATSANASFTQGFPIPGNAPLGTLTFTAVQGSATETASVTVVQVPAGPATLIVSPSTVEPGDAVAIDGERWDPTAGPVTVTIRTAGGGVVGTVPVLLQPDGALATGSFTVPVGTTPQTLTATGVQGARTASDTFAVRAANEPVIRLGGPDRFATAVEISRDVFPFGADTVYIANAVNFPDALSAAPAAAQQDAPLLVTRQEYLEPIVLEELDRLDPDRIVIVGDVNSVSANVQQQAAAYTGQVVRLGGADRFETSRLIAEYAFAGAPSAYVATGFNFPDALTAGAAAGSVGAPMLLTHGNAPSAELIQTLRDLSVTDVYIAGDGNSVATSNDAAFAQAGFRVDRYAGVDRYDTGILVGQDSFTGDLDRIYVAQGVRFPDALAGSAVAGASQVPVYLSPTQCMWADVLDEIDRLGDPQVVLLGDELALDATVFALQPCPF